MIDHHYLLPLAQEKALLQIPAMPSYCAVLLSRVQGSISRASFTLHIHGHSCLHFLLNKTPDFLQGKEEDGNAFNYKTLPLILIHD